MEVNQTCCGDCSEIYTNIALFCYAPETIIMLYVIMP